MKSDFSSLAVTGLKVLVAVAGGLALFAGISGLGKKKNETMTATGERPDHKTTENGVVVVNQDAEMPQVGQKIVNGLKVTQLVCGGAMDVLRSLTSVASNVNRMFDSRYYTSMMNDPMACSGYFGNQAVPGYIPGDYPWNKQNNSGLPYDTPIYRGKDRRDDDIYWIKRPNSIIEVW
jgi:hypothetical protein